MTDLRDHGQVEALGDCLFFLTSESLIDRYLNCGCITTLLPDYQQGESASPLLYNDKVALTKCPVVEMSQVAPHCQHLHHLSGQSIGSSELIRIAVPRACGDPITKEEKKLMITTFNEQHDPFARDFAESIRGVSLFRVPKIIPVSAWGALQRLNGSGWKTDYALVSYCKVAEGMGHTLNMKTASYGMCCGCTP